MPIFWGVERFVRDIADADLQVEQRGDKPKLVGWAHRYGVLSEPMTHGRVRFRERFAPGAFRRDISRRDADLRCLINHNKDRVLGRQKAGTLRVEESDEGVYFEVEPPDTSYARDLVESVRRGDVSGCSFRFAPPFKDSFTRERGETVRTINSAGIREISIVTWPAYEQGSNVELRDLDPATVAQLVAVDPAARYHAAAARQRLAAIA
jgi:HK97 family phage prohead protease